MALGSSVIDHSHPGRCPRWIEPAQFYPLIAQRRELSASDFTSTLTTSIHGESHQETYDLRELVTTRQGDVRSTAFSRVPFHHIINRHDSIRLDHRAAVLGSKSIYGTHTGVLFTAATGLSKSTDLPGIDRARATSDGVSLFPTTAWHMAGSQRRAAGT